MRVIDRYVIRLVLFPTVVGLLLLLLLFTAFTAGALLQSATLGDVPVDDILALVLVHDLSALEVLLPSSFFVALVMAMSYWHRDGEPYALYASGLDPDRLARPLWILALVVALLVVSLSIYARPFAYELRYQVSQRFADLTSRYMEARRFYRWNDSFVIQAGRVTRSTPNLHDVFARVDSGEQVSILRSRHAQIGAVDADRVQRLEFIDGESYDLADATAPDRVTRFDKLVYLAQRPPLEAITKRRAQSMATLSESTSPKDIAEYQWRICMPVISFVLALIGIQLGRLRPKQSTFARFGVAIVVYALVFNATSIITSAVENGIIGTFPGVYTTIGVMVAALFVLRRMPSLTLKRPQ